ncbi:MAG: WecB/TagA/CpsF family glycosyltransferase [Spirochaetes bacterium]|nr:WecB/TagA/CpsF family glycosyltransferase [Spirochaetota bacterium]
MVNNRVKFSGVELEPITKDESFRKTAEFISAGSYHYQMSLNVAKLMNALKDEKLLMSINSADIINADGMPIKIITQLITGKSSTRMGGLDYIEGLADLHPDWRYYFWGAKQEVVEKVVEHFKEKITIAGWRNGYFKDEELNNIICNINDAGTDVLYLAMGTPQKEYLLYDLRDYLKCKVAIGVGGAFDIIAGRQKRAPVWIQNIGMEWFFRVCQEPRRLWKRYLITNLAFLVLIVKELYKSKIAYKNKK